MINFFKYIFSTQYKDYLPVACPLPSGRSHGQFSLIWDGKKINIIGGPYINKTPGTVGVKMAREIDRPCDIKIDTEDFSVPNIDDLMLGVAEGLVLGSRGHTLYVGCMGGTGRTGLYMAAMAMACGELKPVEYVRSVYKSHAVETDEQYKYIMDEVGSMLLYLDRYMKIALSKYPKEKLSLLQKIKRYSNRTK